VTAQRLHSCGATYECLNHSYWTWALPMDTKIPYEDREDEIRLALVKMAKGRKKLDYEKFGALVGIPTAGPWNPILDKISLKERAAGRPDITYLVVRKRTGYPIQIEFEPSITPSAAQKVLAEEVFKEIFAYYRRQKT
jgi:hypothetical protein